MLPICDHYMVWGPLKVPLIENSSSINGKKHDFYLYIYWKLAHTQKYNQLVYIYIYITPFI